jgi:hypothetical protein
MVVSLHIGHLTITVRLLRRGRQSSPTASQSSVYILWVALHDRVGDFRAPDTQQDGSTLPCWASPEALGCRTRSILWLFLLYAIDVAQ